MAECSILRVQAWKWPHNFTAFKIFNPKIFKVEIKICNNFSKRPFSPFQKMCCFNYVTERMHLLLGIDLFCHSSHIPLFVYLYFRKKVYDMHNIQGWIIFETKVNKGTFNDLISMLYLFTVKCKVYIRPSLIFQCIDIKWKK